MSSTLTPPAPPALLVPVAYAAVGAPVEAAGRGSSSYGPVIAMLAVVAVLAAAAVAVGRLCFGRRAHGGARDLEAWVERTCGPCVGATVLAQATDEGGGGAVAGAGAAAATEPGAPEGTDDGDGARRQ
ncbi:hypothetical protein Zm00014a_019266 [Zea mays]|uniref:Uncharacterized protein n=1 Tax=Zea mays TaxID=4577 RepID=A0A3L6FLQ3_MAIZE|nr:hypothetical protein Zm00014a_019266 [Zea mays]